MSHAVVTNYQLNATNEYFQAVWRLTRVMLAAGWKYKASADATGTSTNKDTSSNEMNDKWGVGGGVNLTQVGGQTGTNPTIGSPSLGASSITAVSGFTANSVGRFLQISGAVNAGNNGVFRITAQTGTTVTIFNPNAVAESGTNITWKEMHGGAGASIAAAGTSGATPGRAIVSGLTGMVPPVALPLVRGSVGDFLTIIGAANSSNNGTFRITRVLSMTSVEIDNANATTDANNGALIWVETSPTAQVYPTGTLGGSNGAGAWLVLQGPSILKIPIGNNVPTGTFVRNELVTQTTSGATGTLLGVLTDPTSGNNGYAVIAPRLNGTGGGVRGWTTGTTDTLTGAISGATITTANITPVEFVREIVFWKSTQSAGHIYIQCVDQNLETSMRFSTIAGNAAITNVLAPGSSAAGGFPVYGSYVIGGAGGSATVSTGATNWTNTTTLGSAGNVHFMCANCIETSTTDADGSFVMALGQPATNNGAYCIIMYMRCDDSEEGDVDPYVSMSPSSSAYDGSRTTSVNSNNNDWFNQSIYGTGTQTFLKGWRRRGFISAGTPNGDLFQQFQGHQIGQGSTLQTSATGIYRVQHALQEQMIKEPVWVISTQPYQRMRKGTLRWLFVTEGNCAGMSYNNATFVQLTNSNASPLMAGPWDGVSVASNA